MDGEGSIAGSFLEGKDGGQKLSDIPKHERRQIASAGCSLLWICWVLRQDSPDTEHLKASLKKVEEQFRVRPLDSCFQFIDRAEGRVFRVEARILEAQDDKRLAESQLAQAQ